MIHRCHNTGAAKLKRLVQCWQRRQRPVQFLSVIIERLAAPEPFLPGYFVGDAVKRIEIRFGMRGAVNTVFIMNELYFFFGQWFGAVLLPEGTVFMIRFQRSSAYFGTKMFFSELLLQF